MAFSPRDAETFRYYCKPEPALPDRESSFQSDALDCTPGYEPKTSIFKRLWPARRWRALPRTKIRVSSPKTVASASDPRTPARIPRARLRRFLFVPQEGWFPRLPTRLRSTCLRKHERSAVRIPLLAAAANALLPGHAQLCAV